MSNSDQKEFEELTINSVAGLQAFLANARAQYDFGLAKETELATKGDSNQNDDLHHAFQTLRHTTNKLISKVQQGDLVSNSDAELLQGDYDELVRTVLDLKTRASKTTSSKPQEKPKLESRALPIKTAEQEDDKPAPVFKSQPKPEPKKTEEKTFDNKPAQNKQLQKKKVKKHQPVYQKPKTGALSIASDDKDVVDVKNRMTFDKSTFKKKEPEAKRVDTNELKKKLQHLVKQCQASYSKVNKKHPKPNNVQKLLLEEAREGVEHLELIMKRADGSAPMSAIAEVASHIKYALEGVAEAGQISSNQQKKGVPIVTKFVTPVSKTEDVKTSNSVSFVPTSVTVKKPSVAKRTIPRELQTLPKPDDIYKEKSLTLTYLQAPKYQRHIAENYHSPAGFEQLLDATITKIEADTIDSLDRWLGDLPASAFSFLEEMLVEEVIEFSNRRYEEVTADLRRENIKYETFVAWRDLMEEMLEVVPDGEKMKFGELFAIWMAELDMNMS